MEVYLFENILWGVPAWKLAVALVLIFLGFLSRRVVTGLFDGFLARHVGQTQAKWDDDVVRLLPAPLAVVIQILLWWAVAVYLEIPDAPIAYRTFVYGGMQVALAVGVTWVVFRLVDVLAAALDRYAETSETKLDDQFVPLLRKSLKVFLAVTVGVAVIHNLGYSITSLIASLGIGGLALALAAKDTVANIFGSLIIFTDQPFQIGDAVTVGGVEGTIEEVGFRTTRIRQFDKALVTVPNQTFTLSPIVNHTTRDRRRIKFTLGVTYDTQAAQMEALVERLRTLLQEHPDLHSDAVTVNFTGFGASSLDVLVQGFTKTGAYVDFLHTQQDVLLKVMRVVEEMELDIAFPSQTVYLRQEQGAMPTEAGT